MKTVIDISEHQGIIDFNQVKSSGIDTIIIRLGWIGNKNNHTLDKYFKMNFEKAKSLGFKIGLYVYNYCNNINTLNGAIDWVKNQIKGLSFEYPLFLDMEDNSIINVGKAILTEMSLHFCKRLKEEMNCNTGVYANLNWFKNYIDVNSLINGNYKIWLAEWNGKEMHTANFKVDLWQYSSNGQINGINGRVDMNKCLNCEESEEITGKKTNEQIANEVIQGLWENGEDRKVKLQNAGYNYTVIQTLVNQKLGNRTIEYIVKAGDNLTNIAKKYNTTIDKIVQDNGIKDPNKIYVNQKIIIKK